MTTRNARLQTLLLALLLGGFLLAAAHPAAAASQANPSFTDDDDDAAVAGVSCSPSCAGVDFVRCNVDLHSGWVNDTADSILLSIAGRNNAAFQSPDFDCLAKASKGNFEYHFFFNVGGTAYDAKATWSSTGAWAAGGVATASHVTVVAAGCPATCTSLTLTVPKSALPGLRVGSVITGLYATASGKDTAPSGETVADRAPSANTGLDYTIANGTAGLVRVNLPAGPAAIDQNFANATSAAYAFNWTTATTEESLRIDAAPTAGSAHFVIHDGTGALVMDRLFTAGTHLNLTATGAKGTWTLALNYTNFVGTFDAALAPITPATPIGATGSTTAPPVTPGVTPAAPPPSPSFADTTSSSGKKSPALELPLAALAALAVALRRRK